jgi:hypothetical protein
MNARSTRMQQPKRLPKSDPRLSHPSAAKHLLNPPQINPARPSATLMNEND